MSVETALGISTESAEQIIEQRWQAWCAISPTLRSADHRHLRSWLRAASLDAANAVLFELAALAATDGGDDPDAAIITAWALLPAACRIANELRDLDPDIDALVASQLWIEIRTYNWRGCSRASGTICASLRRNLLREWGRDAARERPTLAWPDVLEQLCQQPERAESDPREVLLQVLDWGVETGTIEHADRVLLLDMVDASASDPRHRSPRRALLGCSSAVSSGLGVTARTVRRRSRRALDALAARATDLAHLIEPLAS